MDKIRKFGLWLLRNKERMILAVAVLALCWRVYAVIQPPPEADPLLYSPPRTQIPEDAESRAAIGLPGSPPAPPKPQLPEPWSELRRNNMFWSSTGVQGGDENQGADAFINVRVLRVRRMPDGSLRAQLATRATTGWYEEGEQFEQYELVSIDPSTDTVVVYSEEVGRTQTLSVER